MTKITIILILLFSLIIFFAEQPKIIRENFNPTSETVSQLADMKQSKENADKEIEKLKKELAVLKTQCRLPKVSKIQKASIAITNSWTYTGNVLVNGQWVAIPPKTTKVVKILPGITCWRIYEIAGHPMQETPMKAGKNYKLHLGSETVVPIYQR